MILALVGMIQSVVSTVGSIYQAKGNMNLLFKLGSVNAFLTVIGFALGIPFGVEGVAFSYVITNLIMLYPVLKISWKQIELSVLEGLAEVFPVFIISVLMSLGIFLIDRYFLSMIDNQLIKLLLMILTGAVLYLLMIRMRYGKLAMLLKELKH